MNDTLAIETIPTTGLGRRIRAILASWMSVERRELTRDELIQLHEQRLLAARVLDENMRAMHAARMI